MTLAASQRALETARLVLEPLVAAHAPEMFAALSDPAIYRFIEEKAPASVEALAARYGRLESRRSGDGTEHWLNWVARERVSGVAVGYVQATVLPDRTAWVAYVIAPAHQRQGLGREATAAMMDELVSAYGARRFLASVDARNAASIRLAEALGFSESRREGGDIILESTAPGSR